jgi:hypothetical protein
LRSVSRIALLVASLSAGVCALTDRGVPDRSIALEEWKDGWAMLSGAGITKSRNFTENEQVEQSGIGPNMANSVGYCDGNSCLEIGSLVSFNYYDHLRSAVPQTGDTIVLDAWMWETALFLALRSRVPGIPEMGEFNPWIKLLGGYGASVGFPARIRTPGFRYLSDHRLQDEGPLLGMSLSNFFGRHTPRKVWYVEVTSLLQLHWNAWLVKSGGLLPAVQTSYRTNGNPYSLLLNITVGLRAF